MPDSLFRLLAARGTNLTSEEVEKFLAEQVTSPVSWTNLKTVIAAKEQTIVSRDINTLRAKDTIKTRDSFLYKNDEIYNVNNSGSGFSDKPWAAPKKIFKSTGGRDTIMNYPCQEYISTDSLCFIWVTDELPGYINPGVRKSNINGAVLGFRLIRQESGNKSEIRSIMVKLEEIYK